MSTELRVLLLTHETPFPVRTGGQMYTANVIRTLSARQDIDLTVLAIGPNESMQHTPTGASWIMASPGKSSGAVRSIFGKYPRSVSATISHEYRSVVRALLDESGWNAIVIDYIAIGWILKDVMQRTVRDASCVVYLSHNVETSLRKRIADGYTGSLPLRWMAQVDAWKAARLEEALVQSACLVTTETDEDAREFRSLFNAEKIHIYTPGYDGIVVESRSRALKDSERTIAIIGSRSAMMKRLVLDEVLESIAPSMQDFEIGIIVSGDAPSDYLAARSKEYPYVKFTGFVADLASILASVRLALITDQIGGGFKHRILTLVFNRVPIVATRDAMAGLPLKPGTHYVEVTGNHEVSEAIRGTIDDVARLDEMQCAAFEACKLAFDWNTSTNSFVTALHSMPVKRR